MRVVSLQAVGDWSGLEGELHPVILSQDGVSSSCPLSWSMQAILVGSTGAEETRKSKLWVGQQNFS